jgi:hypothetical protein
LRARPKAYLSGAAYSAPLFETEKKLGRNKRSSLLRPTVGDGEKEFYTILTWSSVVLSTSGPEPFSAKTELSSPDSEIPTSEFRRRRRTERTKRRVHLTLGLHLRTCKKVIMFSVK